MDEDDMAGEDEEVLDGDEILDGTEGQDAEGQDPGEGDDELEGSAERADASPGEDDGPRQRQREGEDERPVTRGGNRVRAAIEERNALREELAAMRRERQEERQRQQAEQQQWTEQQWNERWAVMTPEEKINELYARGQQEIQGLRGQMSLQVQLMRDQVAYEAKASVNPVYAKYQDEVEKQHNQFVAQGKYIPRELILKQVLGEKALASASKATHQARRQGQKKIEAQTTRPSTSKGDATSTRGKAGDSPEKRLAGVEI